MRISKLLGLAVIPLILTIGIAPALPFVDATIDSETTCREAMVLVHRTTSNDYVCLSMDTAEKWEKRGLGEIVGDTTEEKTMEEEPIEEEMMEEPMKQETVEETPMKEEMAQTTEQPNIILIMVDNIGWYTIGAYNDGIMAGLTPNIKKIAEEGTRFTDYYADPSSIAGQASLITGELPIRIGLTTVGQVGADIGMPDECPTIATVLKSMGYSTGQFGKNHFGNLNKHLPTVHGFDEFFGYLNHLDALEDPFLTTFPLEHNLILGPRNMIHSLASDVDDNTVDPRWGKVGKQIIKDAGPVPLERMKTLDNEILDLSINFMQKSLDKDKPFFVWINPSRMHVVTHLTEEFANHIIPKARWQTYEAGMVEVDDLVGNVMNFLETNGIKDNTIVIFTTDNGEQIHLWPYGEVTPFRAARGQIFEGGMRVPMLVQWPEQIPAGIVENGLMSGLDWLPTLVAAAGNSNIAEELKEGKTMGGKTYKVHLDGYNQLDMLTGIGPSNRDVIYYFAQNEFGAVRIGDYKYRFIDQPTGWLGETVSLDWPVITNVRIDPFEMTGLPAGKDGGSLADYDFFVYEVGRFVQAQEQIEELVLTFVDYPPMHDPASFNLDAVKKKIEKMRSLGN